MTFAAAVRARFQAHAGLLITSTVPRLAGVHPTARVRLCKRSTHYDKSKIHQRLGGCRLRCLITADVDRQPESSQGGGLIENFDTGLHETAANASSTGL
eukprot:jgi/Ulvmu1/5021/UM021_0038.1